MLNDPTFWVAVAFVVFAGLMVWKAAKPILAGIDARGERIKAELDEALQCLKRIVEGGQIARSSQAENIA